jgi:hypothetical protein
MIATSWTEPTTLKRGIAGHGRLVTLTVLTATVLLAEMASLAVGARELPSSAAWDAGLNAFRFWVVDTRSGRDAGTTAQVTPFLAAGSGLAPTHTLTPDLLGGVFGLKALVIPAPATATLLIIPLPRSA